MYPCLMLVTERFANLGARVACLFDGDPVFRELCEGSEICTTALARQPSSAGLSDEYAALQLRLEALAAELVLPAQAGWVPFLA